MTAPAAAPHPRTSWKVLLAVALLALVPRLYLATTTTYVWDEERGWIPLANSISVTPSTWNTPWRGQLSHAAVSAYGIALGRAVLGKNEIGSRVVGMVLGVATVVLVFLMVRAVGPPPAAWVAAVLLAFHEYHAQASMLATEKAYYLFFAALGVWCFLRFLLEERPGWLYAAAAATGAAFLCKESAVLLGPVFLITLLATPRRAWLRRREPYLAALLFAAFSAPDILWNLTQPSRTGIEYNRHLEGVTQFGITYQPLTLYARDAVRWLIEKAGRPFYDNSPEYGAGNVLMAAIMFAGALGTLLGLRRRPNPGATLFLSLFAFIVLFFLFIGGRSTPGFDSFGFFWGDMSLLGGTALGGLWIASVHGSRRLAAGVVLVAGLALAAKHIFAERLRGPATTIQARPEFIEQAPGQFSDVAVSFNHCMVCDQQPRVELVSVRVTHDERELSQEEQQGLVEGADLGTDDRALRLQALPAPAPILKHYTLEYRVTPRGRAPVPMRVKVTVRPSRPDWYREMQW